MVETTLLSKEQAYAAMFFFLEMMYESTGSDELGGLLGSMSLMEDGTPADSAMEGDWSRAVGLALERGSAPRLEILSPSASLSEQEKAELLRVIDQVLHLPVAMKEVRGRSFVDLLLTSGYPSERHRISTIDLAEVLSHQEGLVQEWQEFSDNKRVSEGWFFQTEPSRPYVDHCPPFDGSRTYYDNATDACAAFVQKEVDGFVPR